MTFATATESKPGQGRYSDIVRFGDDFSALTSCKSQKVERGAENKMGTLHSQGSQITAQNTLMFTEKHFAWGQY